MQRLNMVNINPKDDICEKMPSRLRIFMFIAVASGFLAADASGLNQGELVQMAQCRDYFNTQRPEAYSVCYPLADADVSEAQKLVGDMFFWGWGDALQKNSKKALLWYKRSAIAGNTEAKYNLGVMFEQGIGTPVNYNKSIRWFWSAGEEGHVNAQFNLANMYSKGAGTRQDEVRAFKWYLRAAKQGEVVSQYNVGNRYVRGLGVETNPLEAYKWYSLAINQGDMDAQKNKEILTKKMTEEEIEKAKKMVEDWKPYLESNSQR